MASLSLQPEALQAQDPFAILERLPAFETSGPSEFAPIAVGPAHVMLVAANSDLALFRKATALEPAKLIQRAQTRVFFANPPGPVDRLTDPDILFDPEAQRFFLTIADTTPSKQQLIIAVSKSAMPASLTEQDWFIFRLERNEEPDIAISDFDHLAIAGDRLLVSWDRTREQAGARSGAGVLIRIFDKRLFTAGEPDLHPADLLIPSEFSYRARPALVSSLKNRPADRVFYDLWSSPGDMTWTIGAVTGLPSNPVFALRDVPSPFTPVNNGLKSPQAAGAPALSLRRLASNPAYRDGRLWLFEWFGGEPEGTTSGIYWMELDVTGWPDAVKVVQSGVYREPDVWLFSPAGILDDSGNLVLTFSRSGPMNFPANVVGGRSAMDPPGTIRTPTLLQQSLRTWQFAGFPLSIMAGAAADPIDGSIWISGVTPSTTKPPTNDATLITIARLRPRTATDPVFSVQPSHQTIEAGHSVTLAAETDKISNFRWHRNGLALSDATHETLTLTNFQPSLAGLYHASASTADGSAESAAAIIGLTSNVKVTGDGTEIDHDILHPNGNVFDQVLLTGPAEAITADFADNQITRTSFIDLDGDIVQIEFSGPGTLSVVLDDATAPSPPENYHQPDIAYVKGHAGIVITGADERTNVSIFTVGRATAFDRTGAYNILQSPSATNDPAKNGSPLFVGHENTAYDGIADIDFIAISSANGKFGGIRTANANYFAARGLTGIYAPDVAVTGPVYLGNLSAFDSATPVLRFGSVAGETRIAGGDLYQDNGAPVQISGITKLQFTEGSDSAGRLLSKKSNRALLQQNGQDVTAQVVADSAP